MKKTALHLSCLLLALAAAPAAAGLADLDNPGPAVTSVSARQRYPWNGKVDVDVTFTGKAGETYRIELSAVDLDGGTNLPVTAVTTAVMYDGAPNHGAGSVERHTWRDGSVAVSGPGTHRLVWDAEADLPAGFVWDRVAVSAKLLNPIWTFESIPEINPADEWAPATVYHDVQTVVSYGEIEDHAPSVRCLTDEWNLESSLGANVVFSGASMGLRFESDYMNRRGAANPVSLWTSSASTNRSRIVTLDYETGTIACDVPIGYEENSRNDVRFFALKNDPRAYAIVERWGYDAFWKSAAEDRAYVHLGNRYGDDEKGSAVCSYFPNGVPFSDESSTTVPSSHDKETRASVFFCGEAGTDRKQAVIHAGGDPAVDAGSTYSCMGNPVGRYVVPLLDGNRFFTVACEDGREFVPQNFRWALGTFDRHGEWRFLSSQDNDGRGPDVAKSKAVAMPDGERIFLGGVGRWTNGRLRMWNGTAEGRLGAYADFPSGHPFESWARRDVTCLLPNGKFCGVDEELGLVVVNPLTGETYVASDDPVFKKGKMGCQLLPNGKVWIVPYDCEGREYLAGRDICGKLYEVDFGFTRSFSLSSLCSPYLKVAEGDPEPSGIKVGLDPNGGELPGVYAQYYKGENPVYGELPAPTRTGHSFLGWSTDGTAAGVVAADDPVPASGIRLLAAWTPISYTVKFNANGGSGTMENQSFAYGTAQALTANAFTRTGYIFGGWATSATGESDYADGESVSNLTATAGGMVNLYAVWAPALYMVIDLSAGSSAASYPVSYLSDVPAGGWTDEYKTTKLVLRRCEPGTFTMGSPTSESGRQSDETQHEVTLTKAFYIGVFEVTQKQYQLMTGLTPSSYTGDQRPVEHVTYLTLRGNQNWPGNSTVTSGSVIGTLRSRTGIGSLDLPTEAQWEYACRAGTTTPFANGTSNDDGLKKLGRFSGNANDKKGGYTTHHTTVGSYAPNAWGLYDMHGNVFEWCLDYFNDQGYGTTAVTDPKGPTSWTNKGSGYLPRIRRGGYFDGPASLCRSARRDYGSTVTGSEKSSTHYQEPVYLTGFRLCITLE